MNIKKIYTGDYSKEGYDNGISDSKQGKPKSHFGTLKRNPINYLWQSDNAIESYSKSYDIGYTDGQRVSHNIYSSHRGGNMTDLEQQVHILEQAKSAIKHHQSLLEQANGLYGKQVQAMQGVGFANDYTNELASRYERLDKTVENVLDELRQQLAMIDSFQESLQRMIIDARDA
ncbi:hypothetical protein QJU96_01090 [Pasteurella skyensis]|uniref:hypothetical protein n=1 Tax=Phocoenobacter skyensis TaxID=97481 RepID=UPI00278DE010|nr:hypothetical protein [Pasteurella skyensis]MDP8169886.1 hypothetical protein [Pasteurella skyensis]